MKTQPVHEIRIGRIKAAIWQNETANGTRHSVTVSRFFKTDESPDWQHSDSFGRDDLLTLAKVLDRAHSYIIDELGGK